MCRSSTKNAGSDQDPYCSLKGICVEIILLNENQK